MSPQEALVTHYRWLRQYGLNDSHSGNASLRLNDTVYITPTGACADTLTADRLISCPLDSVAPEDASQDTALHQTVYRNNPEAQVILHSHNPYTIALTLDKQGFRPSDFEGQYYFPEVMVCDIPYDNYFELAAQRIPEELAQRSLVIVRGHGIYCQAENLGQAYKMLCSLEQSAKIHWLAQLAGTLPPT
ncbi:MAG: L-fuculose phosphate aldolase [Gammaproteobacteria bacterium]|nr:MAG: L-fuculose phosphate aldolase [Gammaproteobacteria bacterium]